MPAQAGFVLSVLAEGKEKVNPESFKEKGLVYGYLYTSISRNSSMKDVRRSRCHPQLPGICRTQPDLLGINCGTPPGPSSLSRS